MKFIVSLYSETAKPKRFHFDDRQKALDKARYLKATNHSLETYVTIQTVLSRQELNDLYAMHNINPDIVNMLPSDIVTAFHCGAIYD